MERVLPKTELKTFVDDLLGHYKVIGPLRKESATANAYLTFGYAARYEDLTLDYHTSAVAPKRLLMPDREVLFGFRQEQDDVILENPRETWDEKRVIVGLHSCDIAALRRLDKVFSELYRDPYYWARRDNTIVVGITCNHPADTCFCNIVGTGPDAEAGYDLLLTDLGNRYFVTTGSEVGESLARADYFLDATPEDVSSREATLERALAGFKDHFAIDGLMEAMAEKYNDELWDEFWKRCVTCGTCNIVCPTCHCFAVLDKTNSDRTEGKRVRVWDSCHFERFARMAGGVDFRAERSSRFKHRLYDKFYYNPIRYGSAFCVGCGRCVKFCQSEIDLRDALRKLLEQ